MAQPAQIKFSLPNNDFAAIDNSAAPAFPSPNAGALLGYDTPATAGEPGAVAQGLNSFGDTGTVLIDPVNDTSSVNYKDATFNGNPVSGKALSYTTVTKVLTNPLSATVNWKNPA